MNIQAILAIVFPALTGLMELVQKIRFAAKQTSEWTPEMEAQYVALLEATATQPQWQPDKPVDPDCPDCHVTIP